MLNFLYTTAIGRLILKPLVSPKFSIAAAHYMSSPLSKPLIGHYINKYNIDMSEYKEQKYGSFNDFFTRKKNVDFDKNERYAIMPCDGYLSVYSISDKLRMNIKQSEYTVAELLDDDELAGKFSGGFCCVFRLEPQHYHHYLFPADGKILNRKRIDGVLHSVRPICCEQFPVWFRNSREYTVIESSLFGTIIQMEVGALLVGKIRNNQELQIAEKGSEKGFFEYGGSTVIVLFEKDCISLRNEFDAVIDTKKELPVKAGGLLGECMFN